jgi:hypothetical protein
LSAPYLRELNNPGYRPIPGEVETETTSKQFRLHGSNDVIGDTDKLLTGSGLFSLGYTGYEYSIRFRASWTLIQPIFEYRTDELAPEPIGSVADWRYQEIAQAFIVPFTFFNVKLRGTIRANQVGDQGLSQIQKTIHQIIGSDYYLDRVAPSIKRDFFSYDGALSIISPAFNFSGTYFSGILTAGYSDDYFYPQNSIEVGFLWRFSDFFKIFSRYSYITMRDSGFYYQLSENHRHQVQFSLQISPYWSPSFSFCSRHIKGDKYDQWYVSIGTLDIDLW